MRALLVTDADLVGLLLRHLLQAKASAACLRAPPQDAAELATGARVQGLFDLDKALSFVSDHRTVAEALLLRRRAHELCHISVEVLRLDAVGLPLQHEAVEEVLLLGRRELLHRLAAPRDGIGGGGRRPQGVSGAPATFTRSADVAATEVQAHAHEVDLDDVRRATLVADRGKDLLLGALAVTVAICIAARLVLANIGELPDHRLHMQRLTLAFCIALQRGILGWLLMELLVCDCAAPLP
mmetsp:Transcript_6468/g.18523  ORF Transcript_6468/g.18523 Transcript_6468/m.18523 type:complete len:240 (-) Transcript_6468:152-871(-)